MKFQLNIMGFICISKKAKFCLESFEDVKADENSLPKRDFEAFLNGQSSSAGGITPTTKEAISKSNHTEEIPSL